MVLDLTDDAEFVVGLRSPTPGEELRMAAKFAALVHQLLFISFRRSMPCLFLFRARLGLDLLFRLKFRRTNHPVRWTCFGHAPPEVAIANPRIQANDGLHVLATEPGRQSSRKVNIFENWIFFLGPGQLGRYSMNIQHNNLEREILFVPSDEGLLASFARDLAPTFSELVDNSSHYWARFLVVEGDLKKSVHYGRYM